MAIYHPLVSNILDHLNRDSSWERDRHRILPFQIRETADVWRIDFPFSNAISFSPADIRSAMKLVIARDLCCEPDLIALDFSNAFDAARTFEHFKRLKARDFMPTARLTTEFNGLCISAPRNFQVQSWPDPYDSGQDKGVQVYVSGVMRASIATKTDIWRKIHDNSARVPAMEERSSDIDSIVRKSPIFMGKNGKVWRAFEYIGLDQGRFSAQCGEFLGQALCMSAHHYAVISHAPDRIMVMVEQDAFETARRAQNASHKLCAAITSEEDLPDAACRRLVHDCLNEGADMKFISPARAQGNETLFDLMRQNGKHKMCRAAIDFFSAQRRADGQQPRCA